VPIAAFAQTGQIEIVDTFYSKYIDSRQVEIRLPASYFLEPTKFYPVIYMTDGQNVFHPETSYTKVAWGIDKALDTLEIQGKVKECIVVAVWNNGQKRFLEYMPDWVKLDGQNSFYDKRMSEAPSKKLLSDAYLKFLTKELKPFMDKAYRTMPQVEHTMLMGSSMGGLLALFALCEYPKVFGAAACLSTHWPITEGHNDAFLKKLKRKLPSSMSHRIYFDCGNKTLDELYPPLQAKVDSVMKTEGFDAENWVTRYVNGAEHNEAAWNKRMPQVLSFLLGYD
jgi:predicted alpha/beta superfamily hydrolase